MFIRKPTKKAVKNFHADKIHGKKMRIVVYITLKKRFLMIISYEIMIIFHVVCTYLLILQRENKTAAERLRNAKNN